MEIRLASRVRPELAVLAWSVAIPPGWPVFHAISRSRASGPLTSPTRGYTRHAAIRPNKPTASAGQFPFSVLARGNFLIKLIAKPLSSTLCRPKFPVLPIWEIARGVKPGGWPVTRHIRRLLSSYSHAEMLRTLPIRWCLLGRIAACLVQPLKELEEVLVQIVLSVCFCLARRLCRF
jgi:hypothetical protein